MEVLQSILHTFRDLIIRFLPKQITGLIIEPAEFVFLVHPRNLDDVARKYPFVKFLPDYLIRVCVKHLWPVIVSSIIGLESKEGKKVLGYVISCPMLADQMMGNRPLALKRIMQAVRLAEKTGAKIVGLGALTASLTKGGIDLADKVNIRITSGYAYTAAVVTDHVLRAAEALDINLSNALVAVVGAAGSVGYNSTKLLAKKGVNNLLIVDLLRREDKVNQLIHELKNMNPNISLKYSDKIHDIQQAEIIVTATNAPETIIHSPDLKSGAVIVDDAQPSDIDDEVFRIRNDILILEGGVVNTPGIETHLNLGLANKDDNFSCLAEVLVISSGGYIISYMPEEIDGNLVDKIKEGAEKLKFRIGDFQNAYKVYTPQDIAYIRKIRNK